MDINWNDQLIEQIDHHWRTQLRPRLDGLTDEEYFWEPVDGCWNVRPKGSSTAPVQAGSGDFTIDFAFGEPVPAPVTTISWRLAHLIVGVLGVRNAAHFGGPEMDYVGFDYAGTAQGALDQFDEGYRVWLEGVRGLSANGLAQPCGEAEGQWADRPIAGLVLHINRELVHHGAEIALLRDLYAARDR